ncbi:CHAD domain-containing protein [Lysobacter fragariae]
MAAAYPRRARWHIVGGMSSAPIEAAPPPPGLRAHALEEHALAGDALEGHALEELDAAIGHLAWRGGRRHEGVHQARKSLRRVRATLALGGERLGPGAGLVDRALRKLNRGLSRLRDAHALVETFDRLLKAGYDSRTTALLGRARRIAAARRAKVAAQFQRDDADLSRRRALLGVLRATLLALPWDAVHAGQLEAATAHSRARLDAARARACRSGRDEDWHAWRRRARRVSQQRRALAAIGLDPGKQPGFDKHVTEQLGLAQDLTLLLDHCGRRSCFARNDRAALRAFAEPELARLRQQIAAAAP